jgi:hypothetical protein
MQRILTIYNKEQTQLVPSRGVRWARAYGMDRREEECVQNFGWKIRDR